MVRILHVVHALTRGGGLSNVVMNYYRHIDRDKVQFDFLYFKDSENNYQDEIIQLGGRCFQLPMPSLGTRFINERSRFFKDHRSEWTAIHCHALFAVSLFEKAAKKHGAVKYVIAHSHSTIYGKDIIKSLRNRPFVRNARKKSDYHFACGEQAGLFMFKTKDNFTVLNNAIDTVKFRFIPELREEKRKELHVEEDFVLGTVGGFTTGKNHEQLVEIFYEIQQIIPKSKLILIGGEGIVDSTLGKIKELIYQLHISDKVLLLGFRDDIGALLCSMDAYVMTSLYEGFPVSCLEAQDNGVPCFLSDTISKEVGLINTSFISLEEPPKRWAEIIIDRTQKCSISERSKAHEKLKSLGYDISVEANRLEEFYLSLK